MIWGACQKYRFPGEFPGGLVVRTPCFHCRRREFNPWSGELRSCKLRDQNKYRFPESILRNCDPVGLEHDPGICILPSVMYKAKLRNPAPGVIFEKGEAEFPTKMFFSLLCLPLLLYKKMIAPFLLPSPEFWEVQFPKRMACYFLTKSQQDSF